MNPQLPLLFDRQSSNATPDTLALQSWGAAQRVFVSSLISSMPEERAAAREAIQAVGALPVMFEHELGAQDVTAEAAYLDGVRQSGIYVGVFGPRYGVRTPTGRSATHDELKEAERLGLRLCLFTVGYGTPTMDGDQRDLVDGLRNLYTTSAFSDASDLKEKLHRRLSDLAAEELLPWVRIGRVLIRASKITEATGTYGITAIVYDRTILAELKRMGEDRSQVPYANHLEAGDAQIAQVATSVTNSAFTEVTITLQLRKPQQSGLGRMIINGIEPDEIIVAALSDGVFGTSQLPKGIFGMAQTENPLEELSGAGVPDRALRPIGRLLFGEFLMRGEHAATIERFDLGPAQEGVRRLVVTWTPPRRYSNAPDSSPVTLDGSVRLG